MHQKHVLGHQNASKMRTLSTKVRPKCGEEEGGVRRKGAGIGARKEKGKSEKIVKTGGRREIGDRIFRSLDVCGS